MISADKSESSTSDNQAGVQQLQNRLVKLSAFREQTLKDLKQVQSNKEETAHFLSMAGRISDALEVLSEQLFQNLLKVIESQLSLAVQEVLEQPILLKSTVDWKRNSIAVDFHMERDGNSEDILKGQGGSVANILSIGLRMFALTTLSEDQHRRVLILDEQDCWLKPELVSRLVRIIKSAGTELGFQVIMISHHDVSAFVDSADKIYRLQQNGDQVAISQS